MRIWVVEYTFKNGGPSGVRGEAIPHPTAFYKQEDAEEYAGYATKVHGDTIEYRAVAYVPEESK